jgi:DNA-directed RNA polymerase beta subunit
MIPFKNLRQYTHVVDGVIFRRDPKNPTALIYFSENSTLIDDLPKLNLRPADFQIVVVPFTKIPRTLLTSDLRKLYKAYKLTAYTSRQRIPTGRNVIFDVSNYVQAVDARMKPTTYRQRAGYLIKNALESAFRFFPDEYNKILVYSVDIEKDLNTFINRKVFPIIHDMKKEEDLFFETMLLSTVSSDGAKYRLMVKDGDYAFRRVLQYIRNIKTVDTEDEIEAEAQVSSSKIVSSVKANIDNDEAVKGAVSDFLEDDEETRNKVASGDVTKSDIEKITATAILYRVSGDLDGAKNIAKGITSKNSTKALKAISKNFSDELLKPEKTISLTTDPRVAVYNPTAAVGNKSPEHIFQKRKIDFETNIRNDLTNAFKVLEKRDPPLKFHSISIGDKPQRAGEILKSDISIVTVTLKDKFGKLQQVAIEIPKIDLNTGTFRINGQKKVLINQIIRNPITFPKPGEARFESSYSTFRFNVKSLRKVTFLDSFMTYKMPFSFLVFFAFGFEQSLKKYGIKYRMATERPKGEKHWARIRGKEYVIFDNVNTELKEYIVNSFQYGTPDKYHIEGDFPSKQYFENLIIAHTGRVNSTYQIELKIQNIVDPVARQVLLNKQQPTELEDIMFYMADKAVKKTYIPRNDLTNQRIRNSEILVHLAQKQILAAYTTYREQILGGNDEAQLAIVPTKVMKDFQMTELSMSMEYANPIEEMSSITRISPVGKQVGGIPDKRSIDNASRNIHDTYFGNIDPLDTPESGNIGIVQQLTVDALITSSRGMFQAKKISDDEGTGMLSTSSVMTPFLENNDGARVIMITNQAKQMLPLKNPQPPVVQSGYESILTNVLSDNFIKRAPCTGKIDKITIDKITMKCAAGKKDVVDITPMHLRSGSGKNTLSVFKPTVKTGQSVKKGDIVAEGACMASGSIALGRPLLVGFMPYKGYNFEDGIVINERLVESDSLTSLHGIEEEVLISENDRLVFIAKIGDKLEKGEPLLRKTVGEIEQLIGFEEDDDTDIQSGQFIKKSPGGTIVDIEVFSNMPENTFPEIESLIKRTNKRHDKPPKEKFKIMGESIKGVLVKFKIEQELRIGLGDKLCNRHGNKGIISLLEKDNLMPRTPFGTLDMVMNPLGIIGRMNMGQVYETYCGLIARQLGLMLPNLTKAKIIDLLKKVYQYLDKSKNKKTTLSMLANIEKLSGVKFNEFVERTKKSGFFPIIIPPFKAPNHNDIKKALSVVGLKTGYKLRLPEFNTTTFREIPIGYMYIGKLEHLGESKIYGRSTGPTAGKTAQPTAGKRRGGGQRVGEADTYAFISYNCVNTLAEMMGPLSDDYITRDEIISEIIEKGSAKYREAKISPAKDLLNSYFVSLMLTR